MLVTPEQPQRPRPADERECQCEHAAHFDCVGMQLKGHEYGERFNRWLVEDVKTPYGTFACCQTCRETCYAVYVVQS